MTIQEGSVQQIPENDDSEMAEQVASTSIRLEKPPFIGAGVKHDVLHNQLNKLDIFAKRESINAVAIDLLTNNSDVFKINEEYLRKMLKLTKEDKQVFILCNQHVRKQIERSGLDERFTFVETIDELESLVENQ